MSLMLIQSDAYQVHRFLQLKEDEGVYLDFLAATKRYKSVVVWPETFLFSHTTNRTRYVFAVHGRNEGNKAYHIETLTYRKVGLLRYGRIRSYGHETEYISLASIDTLRAKEHERLYLFTDMRMKPYHEIGFWGQVIEKRNVVYFLDIRDAVRYQTDCLDA